MPRKSLKMNLFSAGLPELEKYFDIETQNNITQHKKRKIVKSTLEVENFEANNSDHEIWTSEIFVPKIHTFSSEDSGIQMNISNSAKILDYFKFFASEDLAELIVNETNQYWSCNSDDNSIGTDVAELYCFFAVTFLMTRNKKLSLAEYWSKDKLLCSDIFGEIMARDRYFKLLRMLHFSRDDSTIGDRLFETQNIVNILRKKFSQSFQPFQRLCIQESSLLYKKGRQYSTQYIPPKRNVFGINTFILRDCNTGFVQDLIAHAGSSIMGHSENKNAGKSGAIVETLMRPYLGKGHTLFVDNSYSSPELFNFLHNNGTNACGIVRKRRKGMPKIDKRLNKGEVTSRSSENLIILKWMDDKEVYMLSTMHTAEIVSIESLDGEKSNQKPVCILDYNIAMDEVDKGGMIISTVESTPKSLKWYRKFFFHLLDICVWNAHCLYKYQRNEQIPLSKFQLQLIREILEKYNQCVNRQHPKSNNHPLRLTERHFPSSYKSEGRNRCRRCVVCSANDKRRESKYECNKCNVGLCVDPCFKIYHTELKY